MFIKKRSRIINFGKVNWSSDSKIILKKNILKELNDKEFKIINNMSDKIYFSRNQIGKGDVSDKLGAYRRVQFKGEFEFVFNDRQVEIITHLNFSKQLVLILFGLALPFVTFIVLNGAETYSTVLVYFLISFIWFQISLTTGVNLSESMLSKSIRKFNRRQNW